MAEEVQVGQVMKFPNWGLVRSGYYATPCDGEVARTVALACEGVVWSRLWGVTIAQDGVLRENLDNLPAAPLGAWLGDYSYGEPDFIEQPKLQPKGHTLH